MGLYFSMYVGPYIKYVPKKIKQEITTTTCLNQHCKNFNRHVDTPYCAHCGSTIEPKLKSITELLDIDIYEIETQYPELANMGFKEGEFCPQHIDGVYYWVPNTGKYGKHYNEEGSAEVSFKPSFSGEYEQFQEEYLPLIEFFKEKYGDDLSLEFKNAILLDWS